ncbi:acetyl-CoA carboxylase carboxyltransferase subunit alpha [SCandidatus Aminicenantes bacterium Aminicenantia_JdfR_composite]|jgi:acetyl-CoA carboxylase carboxyl transferase subunit alpha|nr:acetyl-CoA carboxylase carboxyltransferase subunit alpha [SCandidatus Aminicenantes bacterium Aminicenantia_JdfR_composite]MCP2597760.1 acetyl-CoA carboxylase carboxyltransferase subunit alpha [Candidatus Aminicenantes bacterium AC-335-L06]
MEEEKTFFELEKPLIKLREEIRKLETDPKNKEKINKLKKELKNKWKEIESKLTPLHIIQIARHPQRPYTLDYIDNLIEDFMELHGDRRFGDDPAIVAGLGFYHGQTVAVIGHQKGRTTKEKLFRNFGMPHPEGYRKALRIMKLANKFGFPILTFIDTPGAYPGIGAEERGQAEAIAYNLREMSRLEVPIINIIIGEGGSGGALAIGIGDRILMLQYSFYSVISPEGCAAILWKSQEAVSLAAKSLRLTSKDLYELKVIDEIIPEPVGGAHADYEKTFKNVDKYIRKNLEELKKMSPQDRLKYRYHKFRRMGVYIERK